MTSSDNLKKLMEHLKSCFPGIFTEVADQNGKIKKGINFSLLRQLLSAEESDKTEKYEFNWIGKRSAILECSTPTRKTLRPVPQESKDWDTTGNLYIEGDNLDALKLLQKSYANRIKMIYIDPPYNNGNDLIYRDDFSLKNEEYGELPGSAGEAVNAQSHARYHSGWCSMMYPRLVLARNLLTDDGVIFISIDENELDNLKKICNEVFGENNFITIIGLEITKTQGMKVKSAKEGSIVKNFEYILCYAKNAVNKKIVKNILFDKNDGYDVHFSYYIEKQNGRFIVRKLVDVLKENREIFEEFRKYQLVSPNGRIRMASVETAISVSGKVREYLYNTIAKNVYQEMACAVAIEPEIEERLRVEKIVEHKGYLLTKSTGGKLRQYSCLEETLKMNDEYKSEYGRVTIRGNLWKGFYSDMMNVAKEGEVEYKNGKKPVRLICQLAKWIGVQKDDIVMDFFSGSATTAHAVMELNAQDAGTRRFIMVQLNENLDEALKMANGENRRMIQKTLDYLDSLNKPHYLSELGKYRIIRAGEKITAILKKKQKGKEISAGMVKIDTGFRVFKLDNCREEKPCAKNPGECRQTRDDIPEQRSDLDLFYAVLLDLGLPLTMNHIQEKLDGINILRTIPHLTEKTPELEMIRQQTLFDEPGPVPGPGALSAGESGYTSVIACFNDRLSEKTILKIAKMQPDYAVLRESVFESFDKQMVEDIFRKNAPNTIVKYMN